MKKLRKPQVATTARPCFSTMGSGNSEPVASSPAWALLLNLSRISSSFACNSAAKSADIFALFGQSVDDWTPRTMSAAVGASSSCLLGLSGSFFLLYSWVFLHASVPAQQTCSPLPVESIEGSEATQVITK